MPETVINFQRNKKIRVTASDPWDFVTENGVYHEAKMLLSDRIEGRDRLLVSFAKPVTYGQVTREFFIVSNRHAKELFRLRATVPANFESVSQVAPR